MKHTAFLSKFLLFFVLLLQISCTQKPAEILYKGHLYFTKGKFYNSDNFTAMEQAKSSRQQNSLISNDTAPNQIKVQKGDTLYSIARANKVDIRSLIEYNKLEPPYVIYPGDVLNISNRSTHLIKSGENLTRLSLLYGVSLVELANVNNVPVDYKIKSGEMLILPYNASLAQTTSIVTKKSSANSLKKSNKASQNTVSSTPVSFTWPVENGKIIEKFGPKENGIHNDGVNIKAPFGSSIKSAAKGKVVYVGSELRGYGNLIIIKHPNNWLTAYAHNDQIYVAKNQKVTKGETIATIGSTGNVETPQLHFGLRKGRKAVDPQKYIKIGL